MEIYLPLSDPLADEQLIGGKGYNLARMLHAGIEVPPFIILTSEAFPEAPENAYETDLTSITLPEHVRTELDRTIDSLFLDDTYVAVRSSAIGEDGSHLSYAGQLESFLYVPKQRIAEAALSVWRSGFSERIRAYRSNNDLGDRVAPVAVIVQAMINSEISGVAFGLDPISGDRNAIVISAVYGLGEGLVGGGLNADTYIVRDGSTTSTVARKTHRMVLNHDRGEATLLEAVPVPMQELPALSEKELQQIATRTRQLNGFFGSPQDVEWGIVNGDLYILQSRPVTGLGGIPPDRSGDRILWDNSNIIESYSGVTTPLTFSFVRDVYTEVYKELCRILGVEQESIDRNEGVFQMLGLIEGRIYYNLLNWYRVLALLPGYSINAGFMEQMMGVREPLEDIPSIEPSSRNPWLRLGLSLYRLVANLRRLPEHIVEFQEHLEGILAPLERSDLGQKSPAELVRLYSMLERSLLRRWRTPILNDFYTMIFFGLLKRVIEKWKLDETGTLHNDLLSGEGGIISAEPPRRLQQIADRIGEEPALHERILQSNPSEAIDELKRYPEVDDMVEDYLALFGNRYMGELKLETITPAEEPELLLPLLEGYLRKNGYQRGKGSAPGAKLRDEAERKAQRGIRGPFRKAIFNYLLRQTRERVKNRENLRFERTRVFAVVRRLFLAIGSHLRYEAIIDGHRDIFYLTKEEIFSSIDGTAVSTDLRALIASRKEEFARHEEATPPADRFFTYGMVYHGNRYQSDPDASATPPIEGQLTGTPCCPGVVRARVRVIHDPRTAGSLDGAILVAERTDPGWVPLFPGASGLLVARGSLLSHSAIVAREMGIPAIVGIAGLMESLADGDLVEMDGSSGRVLVLEPNK